MASVVDVKNRARPSESCAVCSSAGQKKRKRPPRPTREPPSAATRRRPPQPVCGLRGAVREARPAPLLGGLRPARRGPPQRAFLCFGVASDCIRLERKTARTHHNNSRGRARNWGPPRGGEETHTANNTAHGTVTKRVPSAGRRSSIAAAHVCATKPRCPTPMLKP